MPRAWNDLRWDEECPGLVKLVASRKTIAWEQVPVSDPALDRYLEQVAAAYVNGGYLLSRWRAVEYSDTTTWYTARRQIDGYGLLRTFFGNEVVREGLAPLQLAPDPDISSLEEPLAATLSLDGMLAWVLVNGGAHKAYEGPAREAKALAVTATEALTQNRFEDFHVHVSRDAWTPWFYDVAWDHTYVLTDLANAEITVLCITDTD
ncbi:hypothetical protein SK571_29355 [Lentzea sp. BCCO 10_0798]|uniref:Uncharacterized protein n=1 Tax=Lentzea kristufekii TaxID=3095430 RepID=A0ABU4TYV4_9PSEU|nr:hypothetical protein [Lentzea sp. BCCO 10_0798]MDX8053498.1 hypothetical protein [Lentzea sp. BCCO 10_0798]